MYIDDAFRPFWADGLRNVIVNNSKNLNDWIKDGNDYQINSPVASNEFTINTYNRDLFLKPISQDCNRFSTSALESIIKIDNLEILPKSICWILIKQYYSAFYSAHLILRLLGYSLTQFDGSTISTVRKIANIFGNLNSVNIENGYYLVNYVNNTRTIHCKKQNVNQTGGSHITLWKLFGEKIKELNLQMLSTNSSSDIQDISLKLDELIFNLDYVGSNNHSWLSRMRNDLNYKHMYGVWHPYNLPKPQLELLKRNIGLWKSNIMDIELKNHIGNELVRFSYTCQFIIGLGSLICKDMSFRCSEGKSYLNSGYSKIINVA
ncbi:hypothetical protein [Aquimarina megaterium]|uniref:hypothetical protein n=1 Tax=Aquimarina megaterium TaxID=1443666 RepID=UPI000945B50E|nr:hypothetical protein [Aquimarina megaterium]